MAGQTRLCSLAPYLSLGERPRLCDVTRLSILLAVVLTILTPLLFVIFDVPLLALVAVLGLLFGCYILTRQLVIGGLLAAFGVLLPFAADVPVIDGISGVTQLSVYLFDIPLLGLLGVLAVRSRDALRIPETLAGRITIGAMGAFVLWSLLSALVSNGPSQLAAVLFTGFQFRFVVAFVVALGLVREYGTSYVLIPLVVGYLSNVWFALVQMANEGPIGLSRLGEAPGMAYGFLGILDLAFVTMPTGLYAGGFTGQSRMLVAITLLLFPVFLYLVATEGGHWRYLTVLVVPSVVIVVRVSETDAGSVAVLLALAIQTAALIAWYLRGRNQNLTPPLVGGAGGFFGIFSLYFGSEVLAFVINQFRPESDPEPASGAGNTPSNTPSGGETGDALSSLVESVPGVSTASLPVRVEQYRAAIRIVADYPLFGIGGWNYYYLAEQYGIREGVNGIHNTYLAYLAATGIPGAFFFVASLVAVFAETVRGIVTNAREDVGVLCLLLASGMVGFHAYAFWGFIYKIPGPYLSFWVLAAVIVGVTEEQKDRL